MNHQDQYPNDMPPRAAKGVDDDDCNGMVSCNPISGSCSYPSSARWWEVFKTFQCLVDYVDTERISVGAIIAENDSRASCHLKQCAFEHKIPMMSSYWIIKNLHIGKLLPFNEEKNSSGLTALKLPNVLPSLELSEEI
ncbi:hypothetical protein ACH5RR_023263 [Cinchona calisaya]|uniref:BRCT domain-containing protein n=1 Tax=Cinchona calisaya TaxID=153742 RepID=A0ABD2ZA55_9GENT